MWLFLRWDQAHPCFQIDEIDEEKGNNSYVKYKREVYHSVWKIIVSFIQKAANWGEYLQCADAIFRSLYITIKIFAIDMEEQYVLDPFLLPHMLNLVLDTWSIYFVESIQTTHARYASYHAISSTTFLPHTNFGHLTIQRRRTMRLRLFQHKLERRANPKKFSKAKHST